MATIKVEIRSREMIKPSSPTPLHLKTLPLSFLDQMEPLTHLPFTFFYHNNPNNPIDKNREISTLLKRSLSNTLVHFYPLAGRLKGNESIDCNDEGVEFSEAYVSTDLSKVIQNPNPEDLSVLLPFGPTERKNTMLGVQLNHFSCKGMAICICISHKIADAKALVDFANAWATITRKSLDHSQAIEVIKPPMFNGASHFPPRDLKGIYVPENRTYKEKIACKRFVFDKSMIQALKKQAIDEAIESSPTRVEVVIAFIWKRVMEALGSHGKKIWARVIVDIRTRMTRAIPEECFGNMAWNTVAPCLTGLDAKHSELINSLKRAKAKIDNEYINKALQKGEFVSKLKKGATIKKSSNNNNTNEVPEVFYFSSVCRLAKYEVDFGWGKPIWVCLATMPPKNQALLLSTGCGQGIEAWISMASHDHLASLQHHHHLLSQVASNESLASTRFHRSAL